MGPKRAMGDVRLEICINLRRNGKMDPVQKMTSTGLEPATS